MRLRRSTTYLLSSSAFFALTMAQAQPPGAPGAPPAPVVPPTPPPTATPGATTGGVNTTPPDEDFRPMPPGARVTFNLEDADLPDLIRLISNITGRRFIVPAKPRAIQATVIAPTKVTAAEAYRAFLSILQANGMTVVPSGRYLKVVDTAGIETQPLPTYSDGSATPRDDRYMTRMHRLENISAKDGADLLSRFKSKEGNIMAYAPTNMLVITDTGTNIRRMLRIVESVDVPRSGEQIWIEPVHHANAGELAKTIDQILGLGGSSGAAGGAPAAPPPAPGGEGGGVATIGGAGGDSRVTKIFPDERSNALVILASERAYLRILELIRQFDVPLHGEGKVRVHFLQHADAEEVSTTLQGLLGGGGGARRPAGGPDGGGAPGGGAPATVSGQGGDLFQGSVTITAHKPSNALVITSSLADYAALKRVIDQLDAPRRQVFIEAVIMELNVERNSQLGLGYHGGVGNQPVDGALTVLGFNAGQSINPIANPAALTGLAAGVRGPTIAEAQQLVGISVPAFGVALQALAEDSDTNILSTPHVIAIDNTQAEINIGENVPLQQSGVPASALGLLGGLGGAAGAQPGAAGALGAAGLGGLGGIGGFGAVPRQDVGIILRITPHINDDQQVRLEIEEEISETKAPVGSLQVVPLTKRKAKTQVVVKDQQTVVIGGLMKDTYKLSKTKIPILGDIPLLGLLFRTNKRSKVKSNLVLILTPYIVRDASDLRAVFERKMRERQEFLDRYLVFGEREYEPPLDYSRTRGLVSEIANEMREVEENKRLEEDAKRRPGDHTPKPPIESAPPRESAAGAAGAAPGPGGEAAAAPPPAAGVSAQPPAVVGPPPAPPPAPAPAQP